MTPDAAVSDVHVESGRQRAAEASSLAAEGIKSVKDGVSATVQVAYLIE